MAKPYKDMSGPELQRVYDASDRGRSKLLKDMISAGRGYEKPSETRTKNDALAKRVNEASDKHWAIMREMNARKEYHGC